MRWTHGKAREGGVKVKGYRLQKEEMKAALSPKGERERRRGQRTMEKKQESEEQLRKGLGLGKVWSESGVFK